MHDGRGGGGHGQGEVTTCTDRHGQHQSDRNIRNKPSPAREIELTSCGDQVPVWNEEFIPIMLLQHVGEDLQGKTLLLSGLLAPLVRVHFGVGQVGVVVLVICG